MLNFVLQAWYKRETQYIRILSENYISISNESMPNLYWMAVLTRKVWWKCKNQNNYLWDPQHLLAAMFCWKSGIIYWRDHRHMRGSGSMQNLCVIYGRYLWEFFWLLTSKLLWRCWGSQGSLVVEPVGFRKHTFKNFIHEICYTWNVNSFKLPAKSFGV